MSLNLHFLCVAVLLVSVRHVIYFCHVKISLETLQFYHVKTNFGFLLGVIWLYLQMGRKKK